MKVVLISGSPREGGNTEQIVNVCAEVIKEQGLEAQVLSLAGKDIASCKACGGFCAKNGHCIQKDYLNDIVDAVRDADGLIVAAPVYFGTARGDVMSMLQRLGMVSRSSDQFLDGKVGGPIAVARRGGQTASLSEMLMFFFINGLIVPGANYWNMLFGRLPGEAMQDDEGVENIRAFAAKVAQLIKKIN